LGSWSLTPQSKVVSGLVVQAESQGAQISAARATFFNDPSISHAFCMMSRNGSSSLRMKKALTLARLRGVPG
jgi:hypothetical protein